MYLYLKALHIVFVITWFSGLFYLARLYVYNREAQDKVEEEKNILTTQYNLMIKRLLFGITWPSAIITFVFGLSLFYLYSNLPLWLILKLCFVLILFLYQFSLHKIFKQQTAGIFKYTSTQLRFWNEIPTILLFAIVFLVVVKESISLFYGFLALLALIIVIIMGIRLYKMFRKT